MTTLNELRQALLQTVQDVRDKKIDAIDAIAISKNAQTIINLTRLELDYYTVKLNDKNGIKFLEPKIENDKQGGN